MILKFLSANWTDVGDFMRSKQQLERAKLSPFLEAAFGQLLAEIPRTRAGYELAKRIQAQVAARATKVWIRKPSPSKKRKRSEKDTESRKAWFATHRREVIDEPRQATAEPEEHEWKSLEEYEAWIHQSAASTPAPPVKTQAQLDYESNLRISREIGKERGEQGWDD
jgi:hypothetical protein